MIDTNHQFKHCERYPDTCTYPCEKYTEYRLNNYRTEQAENNREAIKRLRGLHRDVHIINVDHLTDEKKQEIMNAIEKYSGKLGEMEMCNCNCDEVNDIGDFLEYVPSDQEWFQIMNGRKDILQLIDKKALLRFMKSEHEKYCEQNSLCKECRTPLERYEAKEEIWGSVQTSEIYWHCPRGC